MYNPKSTAPLIVIVCTRAQACEHLVREIRDMAPSLKVGKVAHCDFQHVTKNLLTRGTPLVAVIHYKPKATGHVDLVPSGVAQKLMSTARNVLKEPNSFNPRFILYTTADRQEVAAMTKPIPPLSGIHPNNIHTLRPDTLDKLKWILRDYLPVPPQAQKYRRIPKRISYKKLRGSRLAFAWRHMHTQG